MRIEVNKHIVADTNICHGQPVFKGTRIMVWQVAELLGAGISVNVILKDYFPQLSKQAILAALIYASKILEGEKYVAFN